ncbi:MAG: FadR family transcriptional regulator [Deltaproteobacteria bacterium]|nr:FadR family transcriptional regulator [Deltaproteobacteria bacterium]
MGRSAPTPAAPLLAPLAAGSLADRATEALGRLVRRGEYPPRSRLPTEMELCARFGVSRTVVREAVARLKAAGLVESRQGSGLYVREPNRAMPFHIDPGAVHSAASVLEILELRRGLESEAAALAAERCSRAQLGTIRAALAAIAREEAAGRDGVAADMAFHRAVARASGNRHCLALWDFVSQFLRVGMRATRANEARRTDFAAQVRAEHRAVLAAIARRDPAAARAAALRHLEMAAARIRGADAAFWREEGTRYAQPLRAAQLRPGAPPEGGPGRSHPARPPRRGRGGSR